MRRTLGGAMLAVVAACQGASTAPPRGQILLYVDTDAPVVPSGALAATPDQAQPLFDHVRFDVAPPDPAEACGDCTNDFPVDADAFGAAGVSLGIAPPVGESGWTVRVRLYRLAFAGSDGVPEPISTLDASFALPPVPSDGVVPLTAFVSTDGVGQALGTDAPLATTSGRPSPSRVGTWPGAARVVCSGDPPAGMVCVPGGAFWMGDVAGDEPIGTSPGWHRLVVLSPFFLDAAETSVARARSLGVGATGATPWSGKSTGDVDDDWCTFTVTPGPRDSLPASCIDQPTARAACQAAGGDLPSEAQLEYAMGGLRDQPFAWGSDPPTCTDLVWGRGGGGQADINSTPQLCLPTSKAMGALGGVEAPGWGKRDRLVLPTGTLVDLNGNLGEWTLDVYQEQTESFWVGAGAMKDPVCTVEGSQGSMVTTKGGSWRDGGTLLEAPRRSGGDPTINGPDVGFRCARPGR